MTDATAATRPLYRRHQIGDITVTVLSDGTLTLPLALLHGLGEGEADALLAAHGLSGDTVTGALNAIHIQNGERSIMIDAGGKIMPSSGLVPDALAEAGIDPLKVDTVLMTHLHPDHVGGLTHEGGSARFANATLKVHEMEHAFWHDDNIYATLSDDDRPYFDAARGALKPYGDQVELFSGDNVDLAPGVTSVFMPGHTPGHNGFLVSDGAHSLLIAADFVHIAPIQFARPDVTIAFDVDEDAARTTRARVLDRAAADGTLLTGMHLHLPAFGHVKPSGTGYTWVHES